MSKTFRVFVLPSGALAAFGAPPKVDNYLPINGENSYFRR